MNQTFKARIERDGKDMVLVFPAGFIEKLGLEVGDEIIWTVGTDGTVVITPTLAPDKAITFDLSDIKEAQ